MHLSQVLCEQLKVERLCLADAYYLQHLTCTILSI